MNGFTPEEEELANPRPIYHATEAHSPTYLGECPSCGFLVMKMAHGCCHAQDTVLDHICSKDILVEPGNAPTFSGATTSVHPTVHRRSRRPIAA